MYKGMSSVWNAPTHGFSVKYPPNSYVQRHEFVWSAPHNPMYGGINSVWSALHSPMCGGMESVQSVLHGPVYYNIWSLAADAVLKVCIIFSSWFIAGRSGSLRVELRVLQPSPTSCPLSSSWLEWPHTPATMFSLPWWGVVLQTKSKQTFLHFKLLVVQDVVIEIRKVTKSEIQYIIYSLRQEIMSKSLI